MNNNNIITEFNDGVSISSLAKKHEVTRQRIDQIVHPEKHYCRQQTHQAVKNGLLIRLPCEICGDPNSEAHHDDYSKPLEVKWFCKKHHKHTKPNKLSGKTITKQKKDKMTKSIKSFRLSTRTQQQLSDLSEKFGASTAEIVTIATDHLYREEFEMDEIKVSVKTAYDIDAHNAAYVTVIDGILDETHEFTVNTDKRGSGLWIDGKQTLGTCQFSAGKNPNAAYRRYFKRYYTPDNF